MRRKINVPVVSGCVALAMSSLACGDGATDGTTELATPLTIAGAVPASAVAPAPAASSGISRTQPSLPGSPGNTGTVSLADQPQSELVFERPGQIRVQHGSACGRSDSTLPVFTNEFVPFPAPYDEGTIILNGFTTGYDSDQHVRDFAVAITNVRVGYSELGQLGLYWDSSGGIRDNDDNGIVDVMGGYCYWYTLIFWKGNTSGLSIGPQLSFAVGNPGPNPPTYISGVAFSPDPGTHAVLPRGFALAFSDYTDHHFLQGGFDLGTPGGSGDKISWLSAALLTDNDASRTATAGEFVQLLSGTAVHILNPSMLSHWDGQQWVNQPANFKLQPRPSWDDLDSACLSPTNPVETAVDDYRVWVPYSYAVPMLAGWYVTTPCGDRHVRRLGSYIDHFEFTPDLHGRGGWLAYTLATTLSDNSGGQVGQAANRVTVLGLDLPCSGTQCAISPVGLPSLP